MTTPQSQGLKLHHEQRRRRELLLKAICTNKVSIDKMLSHWLYVHGGRRFRPPLHTNGLPHIDDDLYNALRKAMRDV